MGRLGLCGPYTGVILPSWEQALDQIDRARRAGDDGRAAHVMRFGSQLDIAGIVAPSEDADRAIRYLTKYLAKSIAATFADPDDADAEYEAHVDRLHAELRHLPCTPKCANWLRYGIQPKNAGPGLKPVGVPRKLMIGRTSVLVVAGCWCRGSGLGKR